MVKRRITMLLSIGYVEANDYVAIQEAMDIQPGTTAPSFFAADDTIFGICKVRTQ